MFRVDNRLFYLLIALVLTLVFWGCSQEDDVTAPVSLTQMWLSAERLPAPPSGMVYELWVSSSPVVDLSIPAGDLVSLGRFSYLNDDSLKAFLEVDGTLRADSNEFFLNDDAHSYASVIVTVEDASTAAGVDPGPIMLLHQIAGDSDTLRLNFPLNDALNDAIMRFNLESVSDENPGAFNGYGLWFSLYEFAIYNLVDTSGLDLEYDSIELIPEIVEGETTNLDELYAEYPYDLTYDVDTVVQFFGIDTLIPGIDTLWHTRVTLHIDSVADDGPPFYKRDLDVDYDPYIDTTFVPIDIFYEDGFALPNLADWGWKFKGWITSEQILPTAVGEFTPPAYEYKDIYNNEIPGDEGGMLTTGTFSDFHNDDDSNPFTYEIIDRIVDDGEGGLDTIYKRPHFPGEDFLDGAALSAATNGVYDSPVNLIPVPGASQYASVFISLEPTNIVSDSTNFPLIPFYREMPDSWSADAPGASGLTMWRRTTYLSGTGYGFPRMTIEMKRY